MPNSIGYNKNQNINKYFGSDGSKDSQSFIK